MLILNKNSVNELILNINNNSRTNFSGYTLTFTHTLSQRVKSYNIDKSNSAVYGQNDRYAEINLNMVGAANDLFYEGQYQLQIFGNGTNLVYTALCRLDGGPEDNDFITYESPNENNDAYIYIE